MNFGEFTSIYHHIQPFVTGFAHSSKHRNRIWSILISYQDLNCRPLNYTTEYPMGQSRKHFSSSHPKSQGLSCYCPKPIQDHRNPTIPLHLSQSQIVLNTGLPPWWPWLTETKRDPFYVGASHEAKAAAGLKFKGQGHAGQWGYTNMQSIYL